MTIEYLVYIAYVIIAIHSYLLYKILRYLKLQLTSDDLIGIFRIIADILDIIKNNPMSQEEIQKVKDLIEEIINKYSKKK